MAKIIAYCGLVCTDCPAYIATQNDDQEGLKKVAEQWSKGFKESLAPEDCLCDGCLTSTGRQLSHCSECEIRACSIEKNLRNCSHCSEYSCQKLEKFFDSAPEARTTLEGIRRRL